MCFGKSTSPAKSAGEFYSEIKPTYDPLPSLATDTVEKKERSYNDVQRKGAEKRSLLVSNTLG